MHRLTDIQECLISMVECQMANPSQVNTEELGEVIDMIKDISEAQYYCTKKKKYENPNPFEMSYNPKEEKSSQYRKMYMDSKELHKPVEEQIHDLREYLKGLSEDMGISEDLAGIELAGSNIYNSEANWLGSNFDNYQAAELFGDK